MASFNKVRTVVRGPWQSYDCSRAFSSKLLPSQIQNDCPLCAGDEIPDPIPIRRDSEVADAEVRLSHHIGIGLPFTCIIQPRRTLHCITQRSAASIWLQGIIRRTFSVCHLYNFASILEASELLGQRVHKAGCCKRPADVETAYTVPHHQEHDIACKPP